MLIKSPCSYFLFHGWIFVLHYLCMLSSLFLIHFLAWPTFLLSTLVSLSSFPLKLAFYCIFFTFLHIEYKSNRICVCLSVSLRTSLTAGLIWLSITMLFLITILLLKVIATTPCFIFFLKLNKKWGKGISNKVYLRLKTFPQNTWKSAIVL